MYFLSGSIILIEGDTGSAGQYTYYPNVAAIYSGVGVILEWEEPGGSLARLRITDGELFADLNTGAGYEVVYSWILDGTQCRLGSLATYDVELGALGSLFVVQDYDYDTGVYSTIEDYDYPSYAGTWFRIGTRSNKIVIDEYDGVDWQNIHEME